MTKQNIYSIKIGGQAGQGIKSAGLMLAKVASRSGYYIYNYIEYPSLIRGGHNVMQICISPEPVTAPILKTDLLIALSQEALDLHLGELEESSSVIFDEGSNLNLSQANQQIKQYPVPLGKLAAEAGGKEILSNTVALGGVIGLLGGDLSILKDLIAEEFADKDQSIVEINHQAAQKGFDYIQSHFANLLQTTLTPHPNTSPQIVLNGNDAVALGALAGGLQFAAIYPMSPISNILHILAANQEKYGFIYKQPEDEIAAVNMAIGASFAGARAMTATSGGGFCLMTEGLGLAAMTETPLVIVNGMRPGPATGMATWSEQGDLQFVLHAHQGDFPRIVLAPGDGQETFLLTREAFNLADKYQLPVVILTDKNLCEHDQSFPAFNLTDYLINRGKITIKRKDDFERFADSADGISERTIPGAGNFFIANSYEHNSLGFTTESSEDRKLQTKKRLQKLKTIITEDLPKPIVYGPEKADLTIVSWGSNKGAILQALKDFPNVNFLHLTYLSPFPTEEVRNILSSSPYTLDIEANFSGQLADLIRQKTGIEVHDKLLKYDGRPIFPEEIKAEIERILKK